MVRIKAFENHGSNVCICLDDGGKYWLKKTDLADSCLAVNDEMDTEQIAIHDMRKVALDEMVQTVDKWLLLIMKCCKNDVLM